LNCSPLSAFSQICLYIQNLNTLSMFIHRHSSAIYGAACVSVSCSPLNNLHTNLTFSWETLILPIIRPGSPPTGQFRDCLLMHSNSPTWIRGPKLHTHLHFIPRQHVRHKTEFPRCRGYFRAYFAEKGQRPPRQ
jgi:hypothetical protein